MGVPEWVQYLNLLGIPILVYIIKMESRLVRLETLVEIYSKSTKEKDSQ